MSTSVNVMPSRVICAFNRWQYPHHTVLYMVTSAAGVWLWVIPQR